MGLGERAKGGVVGGEVGEGTGSFTRTRKDFGSFPESEREPCKAFKGNKTY